MIMMSHTDRRRCELLRKLSGEPSTVDHPRGAQFGAACGAPAADDSATLQADTAPTPPAMANSHTADNLAILATDALTAEPRLFVCRVDAVLRVGQQLHVLDPSGRMHTVHLQAMPQRESVDESTFTLAQ